MLYAADWRTDIDLARIRIQGRFRNVRRRALNTKLLRTLRRSASFGRLNRALGERFGHHEDLSAFSEALSEPEFDNDDSSHAEGSPTFNQFRVHSNSLNADESDFDVIDTNQIQPNEVTVKTDDGLTHRRKHVK